MNFDPPNPNLNPRYPTDPAGRPYRHLYAHNFTYNPNAPLRTNPYARLPPRPPWPRGNPPPPPISAFTLQQHNLSLPPPRPPISHLFDEIPGPHLHYRLHRLLIFVDTFITALPYVLAGFLLYPIYWFVIIPPIFVYGKILGIPWEAVVTAIEDVRELFSVVDLFLDWVVLKFLVLVVLRPLSGVRGWIRDRLLMREFWCLVVAALFVKLFWHEPLVVEWDRDWEERRLRYVLVPEFKRWAAGITILFSRVAY